MGCSNFPKCRFVKQGQTKIINCIISSTNIEDDTDTVGAVVGSLAGIYYGIESIPKEQIDKLQKKDYLYELANKFEENCKA